MPHEIHASLRVVLPEPPHEMASALADVAEAWAAMLKNAGPCETASTFTVNETRSKPTTASAPGAKRGRKTRTPFAEIVTQADQRVMDAVKRASAEELPKDAA